MNFFSNFPRLSGAFLLLFLCLLGGGPAWPAAAVPAAPVGKLVYLQGQVEVLSGDQSAWNVARVNQELFAGDTVKTGAVSRAAILCADESQLKLNENTVVTLKSVIP